MNQAFKNNLPFHLQSAKNVLKTKNEEGKFLKAMRRKMCSNKKQKMCLKFQVSKKCLCSKCSRFHRPSVI